MRALYAGVALGAAALYWWKRSRSDALKKCSRKPDWFTALDKNRVGLMGYGAIGGKVAELLLAGECEGACLAAVLVRRNRPKPPELDRAVVWTSDPDVFFACEWEICAEGAGQQCVVDYGRRCLTLGRDFLVTSIGALTDDALFYDLKRAAVEGGAQLLLASGAMPATDWMQGAAMVGNASATMRMYKPPKSWFGTPAETEFDLASLTVPTCVFRGPARIAASKYPKNSNIAAMLAFATAGLDSTKVELMADPTNGEVRIEVEFESNGGNIKYEMCGKPDPSNPKTGRDVPYSVVKAIRNLTSPVFIGA